MYASRCSGRGVIFFPNRYLMMTMMTNVPPDSSVEITVNGEGRAVAQDSSLAALVEQMALTGKRFAVEVNGEIVPRGALDQCRLQAGDRVEVVQAIGGG